MIKYFKNDIFTNPGNPIHEVLEPKVHDDGTIELIVSGYENTDEIIASYEESCDMKTIIRKLEMGDTSVLNRHETFYGDFTDMPKTYAEVLQMKINADRAFDKLDPEVKQKFDNDANKFLAQSGSKEWFQKLGVNDEVKE